MANEPNTSFSQFRIYDGLSIIKYQNKRIVGYVHKHPQEGGWFFFSGEYVSDFYNSEIDAINDMCRQYIVGSLDSNFSKMGLLNNELYVKR